MTIGIALIRDLPGLVGAETVWFGTWRFDLCFPIFSDFTPQCRPSMFSDNDLCTGALWVVATVCVSRFTETLEELAAVECLRDVFETPKLPPEAVRRQSSDAERSNLSACFFLSAFDVFLLCSSRIVVDAALCKTINVN